MKTVLSYHHARKMNKQGDKAAPNVPESFVHFLVPLCAVATSPSNVKELKIESQIEGLVEMFEGALEAGLEGLVDPKELGGSGIVSGGGGGSGGAGNAATTRAKKAQKPSKTARTTEPSISVVGGGTGDMVIPSWVDKIHGVLVPGFKGLVDHVARVHLGLAVAASIEGRASEHKKEGGSDGNGDGASSIRAAHGQLYAEEKDDKQQGMEGESAAQPPSPRGVSSSSRRAALQLRRRSTDGPTAIAAGSAGGEEEKETGDAPARRPSSTVSPREEADNAEKNAPVPVAPLPRVNESQARAALYALLKPLVTVGLVGYLSAEACLFAWDQAVIGGFGAMLPRVAAMVVAAAADKMQACSTFPVMSEALLSHAHVVSVRRGHGEMQWWQRKFNELERLTSGFSACVSTRGSSNQRQCYFFVSGAASPPSIDPDLACPTHTDVPATGPYGGALHALDSYGDAGVPKAVSGDHRTEPRNGHGNPPQCLLQEDETDARGDTLDVQGH